MTAKKKTNKTKLVANEVRNLQHEEVDKLLTQKQSELRDAKISLFARELTNPRKVTQLKREIAVIKTIQNEVVKENKEAKQNA
jgi:ribosomal protein L29